MKGSKNWVNIYIRGRMVRNSRPNTIINPTALRVAPSSLQEEIHLFLKGRNILDIQVSHPVRTLDSFTPNQKIYVTSRLGPVPSGFLIIRPDSPAIYWNTKTGSAHIVRLMFDRRQLERVGSIVFSATFYGNERKMVIEDILYYNGSLTWNTLGFLERWNIMKNVCRYILKPDTSEIQGFSTTIAKLESLATWCEKTDHSSIYMWEFVLDKPRTRKLLWRPEGHVQTPQQQQQPHQPQLQQLHQQPHQPHQQPHQPHQQPHQPQQQQLIAQIEKDTLLNLPDSYLLFAANHVQIGAPAVKKLAISLAIRSALASAPHCNVRVEFNQIFKKYEVVELVDTHEPLSQYNTFVRKT
jgi:hypothetical protein